MGWGEVVPAPTEMLKGSRWAETALLDNGSIRGPGCNRTGPAKPAFEWPKHGTNDFASASKTSPRRHQQTICRAVPRPIALTYLGERS